MHTPQTPSKSWLAQQRLRLLPQRSTFTLAEVRQRLKEKDLAHTRTAAVHAAAAQTGIWSSLLSDKLALDLGPAGRRLPTVVYWYCQGVPMREIGRRLSPFGDSWDAERAVDVAAALIAEALNRPGLVAAAA